MLKHRIITAIILIPLVVWGVLRLSTLELSVILGVFVFLGAWEWAALAGIHTRPARAAYALAIVLCLAAVDLWVPVENVASLLLLAFLWWLMNIRAIVRYKGETGLHPGERWSNYLTGLVLLIPTWIALLSLHANRPELVLYLMILIWTADSGAYFVGRAFGKNKLAPHVSPGKTREGAYGAFAASLLVAVIGAYVLEIEASQLIYFVVLSLITVVFSIIGDLMESLYKRRVGVKDSGTLLPGHGGVLDRIDSLTSAAPIFALGLLAMERFL